MKIVPTLIAVLGFVTTSCSSAPPKIGIGSLTRELEYFLTLHPTTCLSGFQFEIKHCLIEFIPKAPESELNRISWNHLSGVYTRSGQEERLDRLLSPAVALKPFTTF